MRLVWPQENGPNTGSALIAKTTALLTVRIREILNAPHEAGIQVGI